MQLLKSDSAGRVQTPVEKRAEILREFDCSGASGVEFAKHIGVKYPTFAGWLRQRRLKPGVSPKRGRPRSKHLEFIEAVIPGSKPEPVTVELPRSVRVQITQSSQIPLVIELLRSLESC
jgi:hypothetical protein